MIIILEGVNGTGKTTIANALKERTGAVIYKPFEEIKQPNKATGARNYDKLQEWGVPVNTFCEDIMVADLLSVCKADVILDRSLPSAIAYDCAGESKNYKDMLEWWQQKIKDGSKGKVVYVQLVVDYDTATNRLLKDKRWCPYKKDFQSMNVKFNKVWRMVRLPKLRIDTQFKTQTVTRMILEKLNS